MHALTLVPILFGLPSLCGIINTQYPHLIVPVKKASADTPVNTQKSFDIEQFAYTEFLFDVPNNAAAWCNLKLTINTNPALGAPFTVSGEDPFSFNVSSIAGHINKDLDTWNVHPLAKDWVANFKVYKNGNVVQTGGQFFACAKGTIAEFIAYPADGSKEGGLTFFELDSPQHGFTYEGYVVDIPKTKV